MEVRLIDISTMTEVLDSVNAVLRNGGIAEIKVEKWKSGTKVTVVEQARTVKAVYPPEK